MADNMNLADQAILALSMVKSMGESRYGLEHPERHAVRSMKRVAEGILADAFNKAIDLAYQAADLPKLVQEVREESKEQRP